jgi:hypothetical protein
MRFSLVVTLPLVVISIVSLASAEVPRPVAQSYGSPSRENFPQAAPVGASITVPQGTKIPLTLVTPIKAKSTKPGDTVRAVVAFPVTIGTQIAIPAGTYVEGVVNSVSTKAKKTKLPAVEIHFTRLLYANGYSVTLDAASMQAWMALPDAALSSTYQLADASGGAPYLGPDFMGAAEITDGFIGQSTPPPPPSPGPSPALIGGIAAGATVGAVVMVVALSHRKSNADYILFDNGWQFQMSLNAPLNLDVAQVARASATPAAN